MVQGEVELRDVFTDADDAFVYRVELQYDQSNTIVDLIDCREIPDEDLPEEGVTIQLENGMIKSEAKRS